MSENRFGLISVGYKEIYGRKGMTINEISALLKSYDLNSMLELSSKLGIIMFQTSGNLEKFEKAQVDILRSLFTEDAERQEVFTALTRAVNRLDVRYWGIFSKHSTLLFMKLALENCPAHGGELLSPKTTPDIAKIIMSIVDYIDEEDFGPSSLILPTDYTRKKLREFMFRRLKFTVGEHYPNQLYRNRRISSYLARHDSNFGFSKAFKEVTGVSIQTFLDIGIILTARWSVLSNNFDLDNNWYIDKRKYFRDVDVSDKTMQKIYNLLVSDVKNYSNSYEWSIRVLGGKDIYDYNFLFLRKSPLIQIADNLLACPSPEYLSAKIAEAPYWLVSEYLQKSNEEKYKRLPEVWGNAFERYTHARLKKVFGTKYKKVATESTQRADGMYEGNSVVILCEIKSIHISFKGSVTGAQVDLRTPLGQCFGEKKGIVQAINMAKDIVSGVVKLDRPLGNRKVLPILVISEFLPSEAFNYMFFEKLLKNNKVNFNQSYLLPFIYLTIEEIELLEAVAGEVGSDKVEQILVDYSEDVAKARVETEYSFKNYLYSRGVKIPNNESIMNDFTKHTDKVLHKYFKKQVAEATRSET